MLKLNHVSLQIQQRLVLDTLQCEFAAGQWHVLLGPNGAGKTSVLRVLAGLIQPTQGEVLLHDKPLQSYSRRELAQQISYLPQQLSMDFAFTVRELVAQGRYPHLNRWTALSTADQAQIDAALHMTDTEHLAQRWVTQLSGGERQRVLLARCLCSQSPIVLLDEPVANLDIRHSLELLQLCQQLVQQGKTLIMSLHDINQALSYAQQALLLKDGRIVAQGAAHTVLSAEHIQQVFQVQAQALHGGVYPRFDFHV